MSKKKKTFKKFINEQVLGVKQKEKQFDKFEDFVKDVKGIKPPENKTETFQEFINEAKGYEFDNDSVDKFDNMVLESKIEQEKQKLEERKTRIDPSPVVLTNRQIEEMNRRRIIEEINEVLKHRDPVLDKMSFQQWLNIPHNKFVFELDEYQAKRLYEQDMSRVEKYEELKKKSGGGKIKVTTAAEDPFTPTDLLNAASPDGVWFDSTDVSKNTFYSSGGGVDQWDASAGKSGFPLVAVNSARAMAPTTFPGTAGARGFSGAAKSVYPQYGPEMATATGGFSVSAGADFSAGLVLYMNASAVDGTQNEFYINNLYQWSLGGVFNGHRSIPFYFKAKADSHYYNNLTTGALKTYTTLPVGLYVLILNKIGSDTRLYVNGVDAGTADVATGNAIDKLLVDALYAPEVICGDILTLERSLTSAEITSLNAYWTTKFI